MHMLQGCISNKKKNKSKAAHPKKFCISDVFLNLPTETHKMWIKIYNEYHLDVKYYEYEKFLLILFWSLPDYLQVVPYIRWSHIWPHFVALYLSVPPSSKKERTLQYANPQRASTNI